MFEYLISDIEIVIGSNDLIICLNLKSSNTGETKFGVMQNIDISW